MKNRIVVVLAIAGLLSARYLLAPARAQRAQSKGTVVEEIVARVNNQIITLSDYQKARSGLAAGGPRRTARIARRIQIQAAE